MTLEKIDFSKQFRQLYSATKKIQQVQADTATFLAIEGRGAPGGEAFQNAIQAMFTTVYTLKFACKAEGLFDFKVSTLECLYLSPPETPMAEWQWRLLSRIPNEVLGPMVTTIKKTIAEKKGLDVSAVKRLRWKEGSALQVLHVGPYDQVCETYNQLMEHAAQHGLVVGGPAHEIYLSDPRRVAPEKLRTIVRLGVKKK